MHKSQYAQYKSVLISLSWKQEANRFEEEIEIVSLHEELDSIQWQEL